MPRPSWPQLAALAAAAALYVGHFLLLDGRLQDDAFISFRYARNLADGAGLVWNAGERVEGYTNFLWTLLLALPLLASKAAPIGEARALSAAAGWTCLVASFLLVRALAPRARVLALAPAFLLAGSWSFGINTMAGLETIFYGAWVTVAALLVARALAGGGPRVELAAGAAGGLAALTRPEGVALFALLVAAVWTELPRGRARLRLVAPFAALVGAHALFRLGYYGDLVPNTFHAKFGVALPPGLPTRGAYAWDFVVKGVDPLGACAALAALGALARVREPAARAVGVGAAYGFGVVAAGGADFMIGYRFLVPYLPLLLALAALGADWLLEKLDAALRPRGRRGRAAPSVRRWAEPLLFVPVALACWAGVTHSRDKLRGFEALRRRVSVDTNQALGRWLKDALPPGTLVAAQDIGELGFESGLPVLDTTGLTDKAIARRPGSLLDRELDLDDVFARRPGAFVLVSSTAPGGRAKGYTAPRTARALLADPRMEEYPFFSGYPSYRRLVRDADGAWQPVESQTPGDTRNSYYLEVYLRRDLADALGEPPATR